MGEKNSEIIFYKKGDIAIVKMCWKMDITSSPAIEKQILTLIDSGEKKIIIDFSGVEYLSSSGLRALLVSAKKAKNTNVKMALIEVKSQIHEIFAIAGFVPIFTFCAGAEEAENFLNA